VASRPHQSAGYMTVTLYGAQVYARPMSLSTAIINQSGSAPLSSLTVLSGTTQYWSMQTACSKGHVAQLPDGIAEGGLDVGPIGGFRPRDPCAGAEFTRFVTFEAVVH